MNFPQPPFSIVPSLSGTLADTFLNSVQHWSAVRKTSVFPLKSSHLLLLSPLSLSSLCSPGRLELTVQNSLASNSETHLPLPPPESWDQRCASPTIPGCF